jgi:serine/threonine-protein kinase RsbW
MSEGRRVFSGLPEAECFFGRREEMERLQGMTRDLVRGAGRSIHLWGPPGIGKTELLRQFAARLFREGEGVLPFYYAFPQLEWELNHFAADFAGAFVVQYLAFQRNDLSLLETIRAPDNLFAMLREESSDAGRFLTDRYRYFLDFDSRRSPAAEVALLPGQFAESQGWNVLILLDDFSRITRYRPSSMVDWPREAFLARRAPVVTAGRQGATPGEILGSGELAGALGNWELGTLDDEGADRMLRSLLRAGGLEMSAALRDRLLWQVDRSPFYLGALVREIPGGAAVDERTLQRAYAAAVCRGEIRRYWLQILAAAATSRSGLRSALEVLGYCRGGGEKHLDVAHVASQLGRTEAAVDEAARILDRAGVIRIDCSRIRVVPDRVLGDFADAFIREESGTNSSFVEASLVAKRVESTREEGRRAAREEGRLQLGALLEAWSGQEVPRVLFSAGDFGKRFERIDDEKVGEELGREKVKIRVPRVVSVAAGVVSSPAGRPGFDADAVAWAFSGDIASLEQPTCWVVKVLDGAAVEEGEVEEFGRTVDSFRDAGDLFPAKTVKWLISSTQGFTPEALTRASRARVLTSTRYQVELLGRLLGVELRGFFAPEPRAGEAVKRLEFEMSIPMVSETELVAARAVEQLAESMNFAPGEIGKIKMALVEACINAFEHSGLPEGKVKILFSVLGESLTVRVENRGRRFVPRRIAATGGSGEMRKRGWGLNLIRELMDEVEFEPKEDGVSLVMVKHLTGKEGFIE